MTQSDLGMAKNIFNVSQYNVDMALGMKSGESGEFGERWSGPRCSYTEEAKGNPVESARSTNPIQAMFQIM